MTGEINKVFTATGLSETGTTQGPKTISIEATDTFSLNVEIFKSGAWVIAETFTDMDAAVQNFDWHGINTRMRLDCTIFTTNPVTVNFE